MRPLREVYRQVACMDCRRLGHDEPWPCAECLCRFADHAIREAAIAALERAAAMAGRYAKGQLEAMQECPLDEMDACRHAGFMLDRAAAAIRALKEPCGERPGGVG